QGCPQPPQLPRSVCGFTHSSPHSICSAGQLDWQLPATQNSPAAQLVAQSPQNLGSLAGSTQSAPHLSRFGGQLLASAPASSSPAPPTSGWPVQPTLPARTPAMAQRMSAKERNESSMDPPSWSIDAAHPQATRARAARLFCARGRNSDYAISASQIATEPSSFTPPHFPRCKGVVVTPI